MGTRTRDAAVPALLYGCVLLSGAAALIYEVLWNRHLMNLFGSTTYASAAVLAGFLGGMAVGAGAVPHLAHRIRRPLRTYVLVELAVGGYAILFPLLLGALAGPYGRLFSALEPTTNSLLGGPLLLGIPLLLPPALAMGATLPLLAFALERRGFRGSGRAGRLYGYNTLGAVFGALGAGFLLLPALGMSGTTAVALALNAAAASLALVPRALSTTGDVPGKEEAAGSSDQARSMRAGPTIARLLPAVVFASSLAALGYELLWTRILVLFLGSSTYAFSLITGLFIAGLAAGSLWIAPKVEGLARPGLILAHLLAGVALASLLGLRFAGTMPERFLTAYAVTGGSGGFLLFQAVLVAVLVVPSTFLLGATFPVAVHLAGGREGTLGASVGRVYAWTAAGNVVGVLGTAVLLIPLLGLRASFWLLAGGTSLAALGALWLEPLGKTQRVVSATAIALSLLALGAVGSTWHPVAMTSGVYRYAPLYIGLESSPRELRRILSTYRPIFYREGAEAVVSVVERPTLGRSPFLALAVDGKVDASTGDDLSTQILSGHLPLLAHPHAKRILVVGLASGITVGSVAQHPVDRIDVVEIEPAMLEAARAFQDFNNRALDDPRVRMTVDDGRHFLAVTPQRYDVIISEPSNPWMSGSARLFTQEFFDLVRARLSPGGIAAQWAPLYGLAPEHFRALLRTFLASFPHVAAFQVAEGDLLLLGSERLLRTDLGMIKAGMEPPDVRRDLLRVGVSDASDVAAAWIAGGRTLRELVGPGPLNTDDNGLLEFGAPRFLFTNTLEENRAFLQRATRHAIARLGPAEASGAELLDLARAAARRGARSRAEHWARKALAAGCGVEAQHLLGALSLEAGDPIAAREEWSIGIETTAHSPTLLAMARQQLTLDSVDGASLLLERIPAEERSAEFHYLQALISLGHDDALGAVRALEGVSDVDMPPAGAFLRTVAASRAGLSSVAAASRQSFEGRLTSLRRRLEREQGEERLDKLLYGAAVVLPGVLEPAELTDLEETIRRLLLAPLTAYYRGVSQLWRGRPDEAVASFEEARAYLEDPTSMAQALLGVALHDAGRPEAARKHLQEFLGALEAGEEEADWVVAEARRVVGTRPTADTDAHVVGGP